MWNWKESVHERVVVGVVLAEMGPGRAAYRTTRSNTRSPEPLCSHTSTTTSRRLWIDRPTTDRACGLAPRQARTHTQHCSPACSAGGLAETNNDKAEKRPISILMRWHCVVGLALVGVCEAWTASQQLSVALAARSGGVSRSAPPCLLAKKNSKPRKPKKKDARAERPVQQTTSSLGDSSMMREDSGLRRMDTDATAPTEAPSDAPLDSRLDEVLRSAGIAPSAGSVPMQTQSQSSDPLSKIPKQGQVLLERFFGGGAVVFGSAFLLSGISVAVEAVCKVTGNKLPSFIDEAIVQYVEPAMTPSILILFFFSISLGLLKQLQLGSETAGVLYTEDDD